MENYKISGVAVDTNVALISLVGVDKIKFRLFDLFKVLDEKKIPIDMLIISIGINTKKEISFTVATENFKQTIKLLEKNKDRIGYEKIRIDENIAKFSIVGTDIPSNTDVIAKIFESLFLAGVRIAMVSSGQIKLSMLINTGDVEIASNVVHNKLICSNSAG